MSTRGATDPTLFDSDAVRDALLPPGHKLRGKVRVGRLLSIEEFWGHWSWWGRWARKEITAPADWTAGLRSFLDAVFPPTIIDRLLGRSVADDVLSLPFKEQEVAASVFFGSLASAHFNVEALLAAQTNPTTTTTETSNPETATAGPSAT
jgi:hypothetical protein